MRRTGHSVPRAAICVASLLVLALPAGAWQQDVGGWLGPDGEPLPFTSAEEILEFLREARVVSVENIPVGVTRPRKLLLEADGLRAHAIFRTVKTEERGVRLDSGEFRSRLIDSALSERAAFEMARLLGLDNVPPTAVRRVGSESGTVQLWIEGARTYEDLREAGEEPSDIAFRRRTQIMWLFDDLIGNDDRNAGNIIVDAAGELWMVDHTRAFQVTDEVPNQERIFWVERGMWERIRELDRVDVEDRMEDWLIAAQVEALFERRSRIVESVEALLAEKSEGAVLFDLR